MLPVPAVVRRAALALVAGAVVAGPLAPATAHAQGPASTTVVGELVRAWPEARQADHEDSAAHTAAEAPLTWVEAPDGTAVRVPTGEVAGVPVGATVEVTVGAEVADPAAGSGVEPARDVLGARVVGEAVPPVAPARALTNEVTVVLVTPDGAARDAVRPAQVAAVVDGPVADFWAEQTGGAVRLGVTAAYDWVPTTAGCDQPTEMWNQAAEAVGFQEGAGRHLLVYVSGAVGESCAYGLAEVGSGPASGGRVYVRDLLPSLVAHELGHNFGLGHSAALRCADGTEAGACATRGYDDRYDVMGGSWEQLGSLNVAQAASLGLLAPDALRTLPADGATTDLVLAPVSAAAGVRAVRLVAPDGSSYWLELRTPAGRDSWLSGGANRFGLETGVLVRRSGTWPDTSLLLDPTPTAGLDGDSRTALPAGSPLVLAGGALTVTAGAADDAGTALRVTTTAGGTAAAPAPAEVPTGAVLAGQDAVPAGQAPAAAVPGGPEPVREPAPAADVPAEAAGGEQRLAAASVPALDLRALLLTTAGAAASLLGLVLLRRFVQVRAGVRRR